MPHAGICAGGVGKPASLPRPSASRYKGDHNTVERSRDVPYVSARPSSKHPSWVVYIADDGSKTIRSGGSRSWRNNNPGNLRSTRFARNHGAIGTAGGFTVFPDYPTGRAALSALLHSATYVNLSIYSAIARYASPQEDDVENYRRLVTDLTGLAIQRKVQDLTDNEVTKVIDAIQEIEGYVVGREKPVRGVIGAILKDKLLIVFSIEGSGNYVSKAVAIEMAETEDIDAVVARSAHGDLYLRAPADAASGNNFLALAEKGK